MTDRTPSRSNSITDRFTQTLCGRLDAGQRIRRRLAPWGRVHVDRPLPFLCVYRRHAGEESILAEKLVMSEASYVLLSEGLGKHAQSVALIRSLAEKLVEQFGSCLLVEIWPGQRTTETSSAIPAAFRLATPRDGLDAHVVTAFENALGKVRIARRLATVKTDQTSRWGRPDRPSLMTRAEAKRMGCHVLGLEVAPIWVSAATDQLFPLVLRSLRRKLTVALRRLFFEFTRSTTTRRPKHYHILGRRAVVKAVWEADRRLADVADQFDFLLQATPLRTENAWRKFQRSRFDKAPRFQYRPLPFEPTALKRQLYASPIERVEDPSLAHLFRQKQDELDRQITMLTDIATERFMHGSIQVFGGVDDSLHDLALEVLQSTPRRTRDEPKRGSLNAEQFADRARQELAHYRVRPDEPLPEVHVRPDMDSGLMVSQGTLLIGHQTSVPIARVEAALQHEIGTHVLTYVNGRAQPFQQLHTGLAGYEALQEGLGVLAEYLVGGLSRSRLRLLAGRVVAVQCLLEGAGFVETHRVLCNTHGFEKRVAFGVAMRVFRGGGLTKDALYLKGLSQILDYVSDGGDLLPLYAGKIALEHLPIVRELRWRKVLLAPKWTPRYIERPAVRDRLDSLARGACVMTLLKGNKL